MAWALVLASAAAVLLAGIAATALIFTNLTSALIVVPGLFWAAFVAACVATVVSLGIRGLRWVFLLRRSSIRIPIQDAYIGYFAGFTLLFAPFLVGEIALRAYVLRARGRVPAAAVVVANLWERLLDLTALSVIVLVAGVAVGRADLMTFVAAALVALVSVGAVRRRVLDAFAWVARRVVPAGDRAPLPEDIKLARVRTWWTALLASLAAWLVPAAGLLALARVWTYMYGPLQAEYDFAAASGTAGVTLAPGGILVTGARLLAALQTAHVAPAQAAVIVLGIRLATVGVSTALGAIVLAMHWRRSAGNAVAHFDAIADAYDVQIPEARRLALLTRKTTMMREVLVQLNAGRRGLDVGCGQGAYVARMRELGFDTAGIDASAGSVAIAARRLEDDGVRVGSVLDIPAADESYDFVYIINVLHHLDSLSEQRRAFEELFRVLRPGGVLFVHEINTRNVLFRFYMGYVFPSLNCIDEGIERWLLPGNMAVYTDVPMSEVRYFTFLPDFLPDAIVRRAAAVEQWLERSRFRVYSAHYMGVWRKP
jgi:ubiquinone/menaquinone biosynthesis C-methylase UbiE